jgi:HK97 family phage major capsid protein
MAHPFLERAAQHTAQARAINDEFQGKDMPAEAARQMEAHLAKSTEYRRRVEREANLKANEDWISEPRYKHDMVGGEDIASEFGHGAPLLESEKKEATKAAFFEYLRKGEAMSREQKASLVEDTDGNKLIPTDFAGSILKELPREAVFRNTAFVRPTTKRTVDVGSVQIASGGWGKLELGDTAPDGLGTADKQTLTVWDLNALVKIGVDELDDSDENLEDLIRQALILKFAEQEDDAFAAGTGDANKQPLGISKDTTVTQGTAAAAGETLTSDDIIKLPFLVPLQFRRNGAYYGHSSVEQAAQLLKNSDGDYLWQERFREGRPPLLNGKPWYTMDGLPAMSATDDAGAGTDKSLFFGDARNGYMIADRRQVAVQRLAELYAAEGKVGLLFKHRVGGGVIRPKAFAWLKL